MKSKIIAIACVAFGANGNAYGEPSKLLASRVVSATDAHVTQYDGSKFLNYFMGDSDKTSSMITGVGIIEPDNEIHPAHTHEDEEYLMIIEGSGIWTLNEESFPAKKGDILYVKPNDLHGIYNNGKTALKFVVFRWLPKS